MYNYFDLLFFLSTKKIISSHCFYKFVLYLWTRYSDFNFVLFNPSKLTPHISFASKVFHQFLIFL